MKLAGQKLGEMLDVSCEGCGVCCEIMLFKHGGVFPVDLAKARGVTLSGQYVSFDYPCPKYDFKTKKCTIYDTRPAACRTYLPGCYDCMKCRRLKGVPLPKSVEV